MKPHTLLVVAFLLGTFVASGGWDGAVFAALFWLGLVVIAVMGALIWTSLDQKARAAGLSPSAVRQQAKVHGWSEKKALTTPVRSRKI